MPNVGRGIFVSSFRFFPAWSTIDFLHFGRVRFFKGGVFGSGRSVWNFLLFSEKILSFFFGVREERGFKYVQDAIGDSYRHSLDTINSIDSREITFCYYGIEDRCTDSCLRCNLPNNSHNQSPEYLKIVCSLSSKGVVCLRLDRP